MTTRARKIPELPSITTLSNTDLLIVEHVVGANTTTSKIAGSDIRKTMVRGPYASDAAANTAGVNIGEMYYTALGAVQVRLV